LLIVLVLLPPSEGKAPPPRRGPRLDLHRLSFPSLSPAREQLLDLLATTSGRPDALVRLGVGESLRAEVDHNTRLRTSRTLPVSKVFTGVLYDALDLDGLDPAGRRRAARDVVVLSALWGALRLGDRIPPYRLPVTADLPGVGSLATWWRTWLSEPLQALAGGGLVVDCRSSGYAAMWTPAGEAADRWVGVRVVRELDGHRTVVSHLAKLTRGRLARHLLTAGRPVRTPEQLARVAGQAYPVELTEPTRPGRAWTLDVVLREG
jgi:cytoplasmic iron level regulating protein YaaA (DUF328/UPF0246 family)